MAWTGSPPRRELPPRLCANRTQFELAPWRDQREDNHATHVNHVHVKSSHKLKTKAEVEGSFTSKLLCQKGSRPSQSQHRESRGRRTEQVQERGTFNLNPTHPGLGN